MLVYHADTKIVGVIRILDLDFFAVFFDDAFFCLIQTEEHAHQSRLAGAVFTEQGVYFAFFQLKRDVVIRDDAGKTFGDVQHLNRIWTVQRNLPPSVSGFLYFTTTRAKL